MAPNTGTPGPSDDASQASGCSSRGGRPRDRIPFLSGNPTVDVTHGILHLYKQKWDLELGLPASLRNII